MRRRTTFLCLMLAVLPAPGFAETHEARVEVSIIDTDEPVTGLTTRNLLLWTAEERMERTTLDADCPASHPGSFVVYFDRANLTDSGWQRSLAMASELIPELTRTGAEILLVSSGDQLEGSGGFASSAEELFGGLQRLDRKGTPEKSDPASARATVEARVETATRRLTTALGSLAPRPAPRAMIYFADRDLVWTGEGRKARNSARSALEWARREAMAALPSHGIRLYSLIPRGINSGENSFLGLIKQLAGDSAGRDLDADIGANELADRLGEDLACLYTLRFDAGRFVVDQPFDVRVALSAPRGTLRAGRRAVRATAERMLARELAGSLLSRRPSPTEPRLGLHLIPTGFDRSDGSFSALAQVVLPPAESIGEKWEFWVSLVSRNRIRRDYVGGLTVTDAGQPGIIEYGISLLPGAYDVTVAARQIDTGRVLSGFFQEDWPDPDRDGAIVGPIAVVQDAQGSFYRDGGHRRQGSLAQPRYSALRSGVASALVGIVCGNRALRGPLTLDRQLLGRSGMIFPSQQMDLGEERCAVVTDLIPADTLEAGLFRYQVRVLEGDRELTRALRLFSVE